jgi:hypothetical protein
MPATDTDRNRRKRHPRRRSLFPVVVLLIILLMVSSGVLIFLIRNHIEASSGAESVTKISAQNGFQCEYSEAQKLYPYANGVLKVTATRAAFLSMDGSEIYGVDMEMDNPFCVINGDYALVADSGGYFCLLLSPEGLVYKQQMSGAISFGALSSDGLAAVIMEQQNKKGAVYVMDKSGASLVQWNSVESGYPVSVLFSPDQTVLDISLIDTDGSSMIPHLKQIRLPSGTDVKKAEDLAIYTPETTAILPSICYIGQDMPVLAGISDIVGFSGGDIKTLDKKFGQIISIFSVDSGLAVIYTDGVGQEIKMEYLTASLTRASSLVLGNSFIDADSRNGKIVAAADDKIMLIDAATLRIEKSVTVDQEIIRVGFEENGKILVITADSVREIPL